MRRLVPGSRCLGKGAGQVMAKMRDGGDELTMKIIDPS
jgi:hypothetical protein